MSDQMFVCAVNLTNRMRKPIPNGVPFLKAELVEDTFDALVAQKLIVKEGEVVEVITPEGKRVTGPEASTPMAAIYPPEGDAVAMAKLAETRARLRELKVPFIHNTGIAKLEVKLDEALKKIADLEEAATEPVKTKSTVAKVWDFDPAELRELPREQLVAKYTEQCKKFKKEAKTYNTEEELIDAMSIEFGK